MKNQKEADLTVPGRYESPQAIRLGDTARAHGNCGLGSSASGDCVSSGSGAIACAPGNAAGFGCQNRGNNAHECADGNYAAF